jgi:hypothetical protein
MSSSVQSAIQELRGQRDRIDQAIAALEGLSGVPAEIPVARPVRRSVGRSVVQSQHRRRPFVEQRRRRSLTMRSKPGSSTRSGLVR